MREAGGNIMSWALRSWERGVRGAMIESMKMFSLTTPVRIKVGVRILRFKGGMGAYPGWREAEWKIERAVF